MNWKKIRKAFWFTPLMVALVAALIVGGVFAATGTWSWNLANLQGTGTITVTSQNSVASFGGTITVDANPIGTVVSGGTLNIGGIATTTHTLGIASASVTNIQPNTYGFKLQASQAQQTALLTYFGTMGGNPTYVTDITNEINGTLPFFFLNISGSNVNVFDGFQDQLGIHNAPLVINDNYPTGTYTYTGILTGANGAANLPVTVTLTVAEPAVWKIGSTIVTVSPPTTIQLNFTPITVASGGAVSTTATLTVTDVGTTNITGWALNVITYPTGLSNPNLTVSQTPVLGNGNSAQLTFTLTGTATGGTSSVNLNGITCTLTPIGN